MSLIRNNCLSYIIIFMITFLLSFSSSAENSYIKINYGISSHDLSTTSTAGTVTTDNSDTGFILSAGTLIGDFWGVDLMYYDLGSSSITADLNEQFKIDNVNYAAQSAGTISNEISGLGAGLLLSTANSSDFLGLTAYVKAGLHGWDKSGSTTILDNDDAFAGSFYNDGIGAYGGIGFSFNMFNDIGVDLAYDTLGLSNDASLKNASSLLSAGVRISF